MNDKTKILLKFVHSLHLKIMKKLVLQKKENLKVNLIHLSLDSRKNSWKKLFSLQEILVCLI